MKLATQLLKAAAGLALCVLLMVHGWRMTHPGPSGFIEMKVMAVEDAKCTVSTNLTTRKAARERFSRYATSCAFEQTIRLPLHTETLYSLAVAWKPASESLSPPRVNSVNLLDSTGGTIWQAPSVEEQWKFEKPLALSRPGLLERGPLWLGWLLAGLAAVLLLWLLRYVNLVLAGVQLRPWAFALIVGLGFVATAFAYRQLIEVQRHGPLLAEVWIHDLAMEKAGILQATPSPRTVVMGGSSGLYGVDTAWLSEQAGQAVVNLAMHAGMPLEGPLQLWGPRLRRGDTALLHLEYSYWNRPQHSDWIMNQMLGWTDQVNRKPWPDPPAWTMIANAPPGRLLAGLLASLYSEAFATPIPGKVSAPGWGEDWHLSPLRARLNDHGDLLVNGLPKRATVKLASYVSGPLLTEHNGALSLLSTFISAMQERGVQVCFIWPATLKSELSDFARPGEREWYASVTEWISGQGAFYAGSPEEMQMPFESFHDTYYHLTPEARKVHTARLLEQLRAVGWPGTLHKAAARAAAERQGARQRVEPVQ